MWVLLVEPDEVLARTYSQALVLDGHQVARSVSAQTAVHQADQHLPDVVILELQLPHHNGIEFLYEFRSYAEWLRVPIIIHSFVPPAELKQFVTLGRELGVQQVLYKPETSLAALRSSVGTVLPVVRL